MTFLVIRERYPTSDSAEDIYTYMFSFTCVCVFSYLFLH